ncbi:ClpX C4-type zinc finger protein [Pseudonocardia lacus]|uniref:ClpX C4-type zinc finger protein n=1 Tax=Pseudonocardia lacus TaxID=2835865 RepID=UPI001BDBBD4A|nr:ClpX C4-type zinc finger protein [Pseudonocardia lacus]
MGSPHDTATAACSFCGKGAAEVTRLIAGPGVWICDGCVRVCHGILEDLDGAAPAAPDPVLAEIAELQQRALSGDRAGAAGGFAALWERLGPDAPALHRATLAHYMADAQDDPAVELEWDRRALAAAEPAADPALRGLLASLQVNVAAGLATAGRVQEARRHLTAARAAESDLPADGYGDLVRGEIAALGARLDSPAGGEER